MSYYAHGCTKTRLYSIWKSMKARCYSKNWKPYKYYGERGIKVCPEWLNSFDAFRDWSIKNGYSENLELDRVDVNGNYEPGNCRWVSHHEQTINRRDTLYCEIDGAKIRLVDYVKEKGISPHTVSGWRYIGLLERKLTEIEGRKVVVTGGKKNDTKL